LAWYFRYFEKKRGHRRTGSRIVGTAGEAIFFSVLVVLGVAGVLAGILLLVIPEWRVNHGFVETTCTVLKKEVGETAGPAGKGKQAVLYRPDIKIQYEAHGIIYRPVTYDIHRAYTSNLAAAQTATAAFVERQEYPCWYDPANPGVAVLVRGYQWWSWLAFLVPGSFLAIGAGGLVLTLLHWGQSAERRAAIARRAQSGELFDPSTAAKPRFPNVPDWSEITSSPGTRLAYRLPLSRSPAWAMFGLMLAALLWNGIVWVFTAWAVGAFREGHPDWLLTFFTLPFFVVGVVLIVLFVRQSLLVTAIGPTLAEISAHPLLPGQAYGLFLSQSGRLTVNSLAAWLTCEEEATYQQGTNTRTEVREVYRQMLLRHESLEIRQDEPFEVECVLSIPPGAMHSFRANHNEVHWQVVVRGNTAQWPEYERTFPVIIAPARAEPQRAGPVTTVVQAGGSP
jgi:hypothetical protein